MTNPTSIDPRTYLHEQIHMTIDQLRQAWAWLVLLTEPGRSTTATRDLVDDERAEELAAQGMADRAYRIWNLKRGLGALAPAPAPARLGIIDAQVAVAGMVGHVVDVLAARLRIAGGRGDLVGLLDWLDGTAVAPDWPFAAGVDGVHGRLCPLDRIHDADQLADVDRQLGRANRAARRAAGVLDDARQPIADRCPACRRKSLQLHYDAADVQQVAEGLRPRHPSLWWVECVSESCRCAGEGCPCGHNRRTEHRRHVWAYGELAQLWRATAAAAAPRRRIRSTSTGRGWGVIGA
ncbi:hypothetical protein ACGFKZ_29355 [Micromonospora tulbaghiae]|uniref:hypothetical protein n=1 Tax=Micromonospora tulbaghiae TaxID=479978 RepID=UPI00371B991F